MCDTVRSAYVLGMTRKRGCAELQTLGPGGRTAVEQQSAVAESAPQWRALQHSARLRQQPVRPLRLKALAITKIGRAHV